MNSKTSESNRCVYTRPAGLCPGTAPLHPKEHPLPAGLGNFRNDVRLRDYICYDCQRRFAKLEEVFIHHGPEAFFRHMLGVQGRKSHRKKNIFYEPTAGMSPLTVIAKYPDQDCTVLWQVDDVSSAHPMKQVVFRDEQNTDIHLALRPGKLTQDFARFRKKHKGKRLRLILTFCNPEEEKEIDSVCADFLKEAKKGEPQLPSAGGTVAGQMTAAISIPYLQAVAKIAFHFLLAYSPFTGMEPQFYGIKQFIYTGANPERFVQPTEESFVEELKDPSIVAKQWCHLLSAQYDYNTVEARLMFFAGPQLQPIVWRVLLGPSPARVLGTSGKAFRYQYLEKRDPEGHIGLMIPLTPAKP